MWNKLFQRHWQTSQSSPDEARKPMALAQRSVMLYTNTVWHSNCGIFKPRKNDPKFNKQPLFFEWMWKVCFFCLLSSGIQHVLYRTCVSCDLLFHRFPFSHFFSPLNTNFFVSLTFFPSALKQWLVTFSFCVLGNNILPNFFCVWFGFIHKFRCWFWSDFNGWCIIIHIIIVSNDIAEIELIKNLKDAGSHTGVKKSVGFPWIFPNTMKSYFI